MMEIIKMIAVFSSISLLVLLFFLLLRKKGGDERVILEKLNQLSGRFEVMSQNQNQSKETLEKQLRDRDTKNAEIIGGLNNKLQNIEKAQETITDLSKKVIDLQHILDNRHARGAFGEVQLEDQIRETLPPTAYDFQHSLTNGKRVDCLLKLPDPPGSIAIDAKFPLEAFHALRAAKSSEDTSNARKVFARDMRQHINKIAESYILPGETANKALMFIPSQTVYEAVYSDIYEVVEEAQKKHVFLASPTTLMALLYTIRALMKDTEILKHAKVIRNETESLGQDAQRISERVDNLGKHYRLLGKDINEIQISADKIDKRSKKIENLSFDTPPSETLPSS